MSRLLIIDDEPNILYSLRRALQSDTLTVLTAETARAGIDMVRASRPDAVILDVRLPDMSGLDAFSEIRQIDPRLPVVIVTAHTTTETAIEATKRGAYEYLLKPVPLDHLRSVVLRAIEISRMSHVPAIFDDADEGAAADTIIGRSAAMQEVYKSIGRVATQEVTVLIRGESGTGKELVARAVYQHGRRSQGPFLAINCASIPDTLLESELFGHERGAFTGAERRRVGKFEQVDGGTLFLDEIGDMSPATQAKVLRLLQEGSFERVGSNETIRADVRVIAATNRDLEAMVDAGEFRRDLLYRLNVYAIVLPPLRERLDDLDALVEHFIARSRREGDNTVRGISRDALDVLRRHDWPGNVRELQSAVRHGMIQSSGELITPESLPIGCRDRTGDVRGETTHTRTTLEELVESLLQQEPNDLSRRVHMEVDRVLLPRVLHHVDGSQVRAAQVLGVARSTLRSRLEDLGITVEKRILTDQEEGDDHPSM